MSVVSGGMIFTPASSNNKTDRILQTKQLHLYQDILSEKRPLYEKYVFAALVCLTKRFDIKLNLTLHFINNLRFFFAFFKRNEMRFIQLQNIA